MTSYAGMISSDWNQCLAPCGPFDVFVHHHPGLRPEMDRIFQRYTANAMSLGQASDAIGKLLPGALAQVQMDAYLRERFETYTGVEVLIKWCRENHILFMINTTGMAGYFQRALALGLLPAVDALSAHPLVRYHRSETDPVEMLDLNETQDKACNTAETADKYGIAHHKILIMGDSGGDGPHFLWGAENGATLIGSMTKPSLKSYCAAHGITIDHEFARSYAQGEPVRPETEMSFQFTDLIPLIERIIGV